MSNQDRRLAAWAPAHLAQQYPFEYNDRKPAEALANEAEADSSAAYDNTFNGNVQNNQNNQDYSSVQRNDLRSINNATLYGNVLDSRQTTNASHRTESNMVNNYTTVNNNSYMHLNNQPNTTINQRYDPRTTNNFNSHNNTNSHNNSDSHNTTDSHNSVDNRNMSMNHRHAPQTTNQNMNTNNSRREIAPSREQNDPQEPTREHQPPSSLQPPSHSSSTASSRTAIPDYPGRYPGPPSPLRNGFFTTASSSRAATPQDYQSTAAPSSPRSDYSSTPAPRSTTAQPSESFFRVRKPLKKSLVNPTNSIFGAQSTWSDKRPHPVKDEGRCFVDGCEHHRTHRSVDGRRHKVADWMGGGARREEAGVVRVMSDFCDRHTCRSGGAGRRGRFCACPKYPGDRRCSCCVGRGVEE